MNRVLKGIGFTVCGTTHYWQQEVLGHDFTACGKMQTVEQEVSGHDFSRAASAQKQMSGFSPCGLLFV
jgi:hypothetical protein